MPELQMSTYELERAREMVLNFRQKFGEGHFWLACHAAFPLALTPNLLYTMRANFLFDNKSALLHTPWIAVADILLNLCKETGQELYQMEASVREVLLQELRQNQRFLKGNYTLNRLEQLSLFLLAYVERHLYSSDDTLRTFAEAQSWSALTYIHPEKAAQKIATALAEAQDRKDEHEQIRLQLLLNNLLATQPELDRLRQYAQGNAEVLRGNVAAAQEIVGNQSTEDKIEIAGVALKNIAAKKEATPIEKIQQGLKDLGYFDGNQTGKMDDPTTKAVQAFLGDEEIDGEGKSLTFILREIEAALQSGLKKVNPEAPVKVYLSNSNQLRFANNFRNFYRQLMDTLGDLEQEGIITLDYYSKYDLGGKVDKDRIIEAREQAELTLMPVNPDLVKGGLRNRKNIVGLYNDKMASGKGLVVPIVLEELKEFQDDFALYPQLPKDGAPLESDSDNKTRLPILLREVAQLIHYLHGKKSEFPEGFLRLQKEDFNYLYNAQANTKTEAIPLTIYLSYTLPDREMVEELVREFEATVNVNFVNPEFELEGVNYRDIEEERRAMLEQANLVMAFLSPHYLASGYHLQEEYHFALRHENINLLPILFRPCLTEWTELGALGGLPKTGMPFSENQDFKSLANELNGFIQKFYDLKTGLPILELPKSDRNTTDFYELYAEIPPINNMGSLPKKLLIRYHPADRAYFDRFVLHLKSLAPYNIFDIDEQEFGISKIDPLTEQYYAIDRAEVIINLVSSNFRGDQVFMETLLQILANVQSGAQNAFNVPLQFTNTDATQLDELKSLLDFPISEVNSDSAWIAACKNLIYELSPLIDESVAEPVDPKNYTIEDLFGMAQREEWEELDLSNRQLKSFPQTFGPTPSLTKLNLASNNLQELPDTIFKDFPNITEINLADNILEELPEEISQWQNLRSLNVSNNRLTRLPITLNLIEPLPEIQVFNNRLPISGKVVHDHPEDLFDLILTNQDRVKNWSKEEKENAQEALSDFQEMKIDGILGPQFFEILYQWQIENGLTPGALDDATIDLLLSPKEASARPVEWGNPEFPQEQSSSEEVAEEETRTEKEEDFENTQKKFSKEEEEAAKAGNKAGNRSNNFHERQLEIIDLLTQTEISKALNEAKQLRIDFKLADGFRVGVISLESDFNAVEEDYNLALINRETYTKELTEISSSLFDLVQRAEVPKPQEENPGIFGRLRNFFTGSSDTSKEEATSNTSFNKSKRQEIEKIQILISKNEMKTALTQTGDLIRSLDINKDFEKEWILISANYNQLEASIVDNTVSTKDRRVRINQIILNLLDLLDKIENYDSFGGSFGGDPTD